MNTSAQNNVEYLVPDSLLERYFKILTKVGLNKYLSASIILTSTYLIIQYSLELISGFKIVKLSNIFIVRDILSTIVIPPLYLYFFEKLRELPFEIKDNIKMESNELLNFFKIKLRDVVDGKKMVLIGLLFSSYYFVLINWYLHTNYYSIRFYTIRLIGVFGVFLVGCVVYQAIVLLKIFIYDVRELPLEISSIINGLTPVSSLASIATVLWITMVTLIMMPVFFLSFNPRSYLWYIGFYGVLYGLGLVIFILLMYGFHVSMVGVKKDNLSSLTRFLNEIYSDIKTIRGSDTSLNLVGLVAYIDLYEKVINGKEWPFEISSIREVIFSYVIPLAMYLVSLI